MLVSGLSPDLGFSLTRLCQALDRTDPVPIHNKERTSICKVTSDEAILMLRDASLIRVNHHFAFIDSLPMEHRLA